MNRSIIMAIISTLFIVSSCKEQRTESKEPAKPKMLGRPVDQSFARDSTFSYGDGVKLHVVTIPFDTAKHTIGTEPTGWVCTIDGKPFFGTDGGVPRTQLVAMSVEINGRKIDLDVSGMFEAWPEKENFWIECDTTEGNYSGTVVGVFSDAAGAYAAEWEVRDSGSIRTILTRAGNDIGEIVGAPVYHRWDTTTH